jgi:hypothetical protein
LVVVVEGGTAAASVAVVVSAGTVEVGLLEVVVIIGAELPFPS